MLNFLGWLRARPVLRVMLNPAMQHCASATLMARSACSIRNWIPRAARLLTQKPNAWPRFPLAPARPVRALPVLRGARRARYPPRLWRLRTILGRMARNAAALTASLGHEPDASELYLAHFLGSAGAGRFLNALASDPAQSAAALLPAAAGANRSIFYTPAGAPRSVSEVMGLIRAKVDGAMEGGEGPGPGLPAPFASPDAAFPTALAAAAPPSVPMGPIAREFHAAAPPAQERPSMAETLRQAFALGTQAGSAAPGHVRTAYARLSAMGL